MDAPLLNIVLTVICVFFVSTRILRAGPSHLFALLVSGALCAFLLRHSSSLKDRYLLDMERKYEAIGAPGNMHLDARLVQFFFWLRDWRALNPDAFDNAVTATDNLLLIEKDVTTGSARCSDEYGVALAMYRAAMNHLHSFVFSLEHPVQVTRLRNALRALQELLLAHVTLIGRTCGNVTPLAQPAPFDPGADGSSARFPVY